MKKVNLELTIDQLNVIVASLGKMSYESVFQVINEIQNQIQPQLKEQSKET